METKKSQDPKSANWWTRKSCSAVQFKSKGLRTRRVNSVNPNSSLNTLEPGEWYQRAGEDGYFSPSENSANSLFLPFSIQAFIKLGDAPLPLGGHSSLLSLLIQMLISYRNTMTNNILSTILATHSSLILAYKINCHTLLYFLTHGLPKRVAHNTETDFHWSYQWRKQERERSNWSPFCSSEISC